MADVGRAVGAAAADGLLCRLWPVGGAGGHGRREGVSRAVHMHPLAASKQPRSILEPPESLPPSPRAGGAPLTGRPLGSASPRWLFAAAETAV